MIPGSTTYPGSTNYPGYVPTGSPSTNTIIVLQVQIAFTSPPLSVAPTWVDVTPWVLGGNTYPLSTARGRSYELDQIQPGTMSLTLNNDDGRFTPELVTSPYYPNIQPMKRIQVSATLNALTTILFDGCISEWPTSWVGTTARSRVQITASDIQDLASHHVLKALYQEEILKDLPTYYWPLSDPSGNATAADLVQANDGTSLSVRTSGRTDPTNGGGNLEFGSGTGPGNDGLSAPLFVSGTDSRAGDFVWLGANPKVPDMVPTPGVSYEVTFATSVPLGGTWMGILGSLSPSTSTEYIALSIESGGGTLTAYWVMTQTSGATARKSVSSVTSVWNGRTHHAVFTITDNLVSNTSTGNLYVDGVLVGTTVGSGGTHGGITGAGSFGIGEAAAGGAMRGFDGTISHVAVYPFALTGTQVSHHYQAELGWPGQTTDQRIATIARYWGVQSLNLDIGNSTLQGQPTNGVDVFTALNTAGVDSEDGIVFINRSGVLTFQNRWHRVNRSVGFTVTAGQISPDLNLGYDAQLVVNSVTVGPEGGQDGTVVVSDLSSVAVYDVRSQSLTTVLAPTDMAYRGQALLEKLSLPRLRVTNGVTFRPDQNLTLINQILALDIGDSFAISGLPANGPSSTLEFDVDGIQLQFTLPQVTYTITASPRPRHTWGVVGTGAASLVGTTNVVGW